MNIIGKIFVFAVFVMSLVLMTFAGVIYMSHMNWKDEVYRDPDRLPARPAARLQVPDRAGGDGAGELEDAITALQQKVAESEAVARPGRRQAADGHRAEEQGTAGAAGREGQAEAEQEKAVDDVRPAPRGLLSGRQERREAPGRRCSEQQAKVDAQVDTLGGARRPSCTRRRR